MKEISIIIPVYNSEAYLSECVDSVLNQAYENFELILVNDGSTDESGQICDSYSKKDKRVRVIHKENGGVSSARNVGIEKSSGDYIIFIDSDDSIDLDLLDYLKDVADKYNTSMVIHSLGLFNDANEQNEHETLEMLDKRKLVDYMPVFIKRRYINAPRNKLYRRSIIIDNNIRFDEGVSMGEDALFNYEYFSTLTDLILIERNFYHYRENEESLTHKFIKKKYDMLISVNNRLQELVRTNENFSKCKSAANFIRIKNIYSSIFDILDNDEVSKKDVNALFNKIFRTNQRFNLNEIDERKFKILAKAVNSNNKLVLKNVARLVYNIAKK
ncbi:MAG: glycosyltransferase family 2 protein [Anaerococcus sp.]|nr:glycosyltransferase family 2 protein [Anaerococcus sp.]